MTLRPFEEIVTEHGAVVMRVCRAMLAPSDADDAWAETFIAALRAYPDLRPDSNVRGWLVTIAHRKAIDVTRSTRRRPRPTADIADIADVAGIAQIASTMIGDPAVDGRDERVWAALAALAPKQRAAVTYHHVAGMPYAEVGDLLGTTAAAARRSAADGIARLRSILLGTTPHEPAGDPADGQHHHQHESHTSMKATGS